MSPRVVSGKPIFVARVIGRDTIIAGKRYLIAPTSTGPVDGRNRRNLQGREAIEHFLTFRNKRAQFAGLRLLKQRLEIGARDEDGFLGGREEESRIDGSFSIASRWSLKFCMVGTSKMLAPDLGRSKVNTQIPSLPISRRIMVAVPVAVISLILAGFSEIPSPEEVGNGVLEHWSNGQADQSGLARRSPTVSHYSILRCSFSPLPNPPSGCAIALRGGECYKARRRAVHPFTSSPLWSGKSSNQKSGV